MWEDFCLFVCFGSALVPTDTHDELRWPEDMGRTQRGRLLSIADARATIRTHFSFISMSWSTVSATHQAAVPSFPFLRSLFGSSFSPRRLSRWIRDRTAPPAVWNPSLAPPGAAACSIKLLYGYMADSLGAITRRLSCRVSSAFPADWAPIEWIILLVAASVNLS